MKEDKEMMKLVVSILQEDPTKEVKIIKLPSTVKNDRRMMLRGKRTCG